uniref:Uncharacterized protein n=1 Tax=Ascaris lumbricoides TaxID=6252 RepID=A0A9J2P4A3_ASCLU
MRRRGKNSECAVIAAVSTATEEPIDRCVTTGEKELSIFADTLWKIWFVFTRLTGTRRSTRWKACDPCIWPPDQRVTKAISDASFTNLNIASVLKALLDFISSDTHENFGLMSFLENSGVNFPERKHGASN